MLKNFIENVGQKKNNTELYNDKAKAQANPPLD